MDPTLNPLRILVVSGLEERRRDVTGAIESLGHLVIQEAEPSRVGPATSAERPDVARLRPFYEELIAEFFPAELRW